MSRKDVIASIVSSSLTHFEGSSTRRESWLEVAFDWLLRSDSISFPADFEDSQPMEEHKTVSSGPYSSSKVATCEVSTQTVAIDEEIVEVKTTEGRRASGMSRFGGYSEETKKESDHSTKEMNVTTPAMTASTENKFRTPLRTGSPIDFIDTRGEEDLPSTSTVVSSTKGCSCIIS